MQNLEHLFIFTRTKLFFLHTKEKMLPRHIPYHAGVNNNLKGFV